MSIAASKSYVAVRSLRVLAASRHATQFGVSHGEDRRPVIRQTEADERANWIRLAMRVGLGWARVGGSRGIAQLTAKVLKERGVADEGLGGGARQRSRRQVTVEEAV